MTYTLWLNKPESGTGIQLAHPGAEQPYAVWFRNEIEKFCATRTEADELLAYLYQNPPPLEEELDGAS